MSQWVCVISCLVFSGFVFLPPQKKGGPSILENKCILHSLKQKLYWQKAFYFFKYISCGYNFNPR